MLGLVIALVSAFAAPIHVQADEDLPGQLSYINADLDVFIPLLEDYQDSYYVTNDQYFQSLVSHNTPPSGVTAPDNLDSHPEDQDETLADLWEYASLPDEIAWSFRIDIYSGTGGDGYVLIVETMIDGDTWHREINFGPESYRNMDWFLVTPW
jgi:hypothetical protein